MRRQLGWGRQLFGLCGLVPFLVTGTGCEDPQGFARVERQTEVVASFQNKIVEGKARLEYTSSVPAKQHPEFLVNWVNLNQQITVELYVFRRQDYEATDANQEPNRNKPPMELAQELTDRENAEMSQWEADCAANYPNQDPCPIAKPPIRILWPLLPLEGPQFGDRLPTQLHLHPTTDDWVIVFYNPLERSPANRAEISGSVELSYFSLP